MAIGDGFYRIKRLPPYVFAQVQTLKLEARQRGEDIIDFGMGNPDQPTPPHIVDKLIEASRKAKNHRYSASRGITKLRHAITGWYKRNYDVDLDPETEAIVTIGSKEGIAHLALATIGPGDVVLTPTPTYPIHMYSFIIAGGEVRGIELRQDSDFFDDLLRVYRQTLPRPRILVINFPHNPTTAVVDLEFFKKIVAFAKEHDVIVIHDLAYADIAFDGYKAPSFLQVPEAKDVGVEFYTLSKAYNMPGWRVGFCVGNREVVGALAKLKSYLDYGIFQPIQIASTVALNGPQDCVKEVVQRYQNRRNVLVNGLNRIGWPVALPRATMFVWARIPDPFRHMGSLEFSKLLLREAKVAVSPGIGFGEGGDEFVRFALVENEHRTRQALRGIRKVLNLDDQES
ncbi:MAG TPA: alanine transaminase [Nitrospira sp.]|jgi:alanine-synthesizing transaminase|uniref:alanine transaminase n=1 Tax=Nitrospira sp. ND1 TaxID=1658518 RepID=UPI0009B98728|nr:alanine transaminase [Nitrospira sp. ND1]MBK7418111.1 alanine transaminase [Nitrospira sp.]MDQ1291336.1 alanine-synthesizing transaminase [Nitrospirota bacterium]OYT24564.1 MAG: alanine transaminase [Nitrospira sp. UW-LDO-02]MBK7484651.1 alanine transaminase [Nitrospira sp.]MBK8376907.1 alanine transaminase [Nitrospira sp.]